MLKVKESFLGLLVGVGTGNDGDEDAPLSSATTGDLSCIASAKACSAREREARDTLQYRAFPTRLITYSNELHRG